MSKASTFATLVAVALCWFTVSCAGVVFFKPPAAAVLASAAVPAAPTPPLATAGTSVLGSGAVLFVAGLAALGLTMFFVERKTGTTTT